MRFAHALKKEILLLLRDPAGLGILFILPGVMVFLITFIQDLAFNRFNETKLEILMADEDADTLGVKIKKGFDASGAFKLVTEQNGTPLNTETVTDLVAKGKYEIGIIIPKGSTQKIRDNASQILASAFNPEAKSGTSDDTSKITLLYDPALLPSFKASVNAHLDKNITQIQSGILVDAFSKEMQQLVPGMQPISLEGNVGLEVHEAYARKAENKLEPNAVQHNVPAWTIFAMFFIVIPLATNMVREKDNGIEMRLRTIPGSYFYSITGKMAAYQLVCMVQFIFMISVGILAMPLMGMPALAIGTNLPELIITAGLTALAATAFGILVGTVAGTHDQAASFGSITVIIMAAIGGIWVPTFAMPEVVKKLGNLSPLNWSLNAFYDVFLRNASVDVLWINWTKLLVFTFVLAGISLLIKKLRRAG
ncbi:MAG: ABC transporter permease [Flavobacteriales bacterium]|nr:ABC transporter permease [Flavobacteriales bacterium]